ncbi:MAG: lanthionine synthetase C family protein [Bacteroidales bacterium]
MNLLNIEPAISNIANTIQNETSQAQEGNIGLMGGDAGIALFLIYYSIVYKKESALDKALQLISDSLDAINNGNTNSLYSSGIGGLFWLISFLKNNDLLDYDDSESIDKIETYLSQRLDDTLNPDNFDYDVLHGGLGYVMYFIERYNNKIDQNFINKIATAYSKSAITIDKDRIAWKSKFNKENNADEINFGLAHGIPSILIVLTKLYTFTNKENKILLEDLITKGANYLISQKSFFKENSSFYPYSNLKKGHSRLAWCYGDLGIAYSLYKVGTAIQDSKIEQEGLQTLLASTSRKDLAINDVMDAEVCHGAAGLMLQYGSFYKEMGLPEFKQASEYWLDQTLKMGNNENFLGGYKFWYYNDKQKEMSFKSDTGLLTGIAGIGLTLLSHIDNYTLNWDRSLLLRL